MVKHLPNSVTKQNYNIIGMKTMLADTYKVVWTRKPLWLEAKEIVSGLKRPQGIMWMGLLKIGGCLEIRIGNHWKYNEISH